MLAALAPDWVADTAILAVDDQGRQIAYGDLDTLRSNWKERVPGRRLVALFCTNDVPCLSAYIGLHAAGHVVLLLSAKLAPAARSQLIDRYRIEAVVDGEKVEILSEPETDLHADLTVCLSTSGSTGSPKLVQFSDAQLVSNARSIADYLKLSEDDVPLCHLPIEYSFGLSVLHSHMAIGAKILLTNHSVMQKSFWELFRSATNFSGVPFHFEMLLRMRLASQELPNLRMLTQAGGRLAPNVAEALYELACDKGWEFHIMYGQTEAGPRIAWLPFDVMRNNWDKIGKPIPGVSLELADDGELIVNSPSVMLGYATERSDLKNGDQLDGRLFTGDVAEEVEDLYRIVGRKSGFIKLQGNRVSLSDIETRLGEAGFRVACVGQDDKLTIFSTDNDVEAVRRAAVELFSFPPRSMDIRHLKSLPRGTNDKTDYVALETLSKAE